MFQSIRPQIESRLVKVYGIRDLKAGSMNPAYYFNTHGQAEREFHKLTNHADSAVFRYPEDYQLFYLANYDEMSGQFHPLKNGPELVCDAASLKSKPEQSGPPL